METFNKFFETGLEFGQEWLRREITPEKSTFIPASSGAGNWFARNWTTVAVTVIGGIVAILVVRWALKK